MLLQDHDRVELIKPNITGDIGDQFLSKNTHNSGIWRPTSSIPGQQCSEHVLVLSAWKWCQQGASKGNNRMWIITALPQFYLAVESLGLGIFPYCSKGCITPAPAHFIHAAHTLPPLILRNFNVFLLLLVLWFCSMSGSLISILPHVWSCISSPWQPTGPSFSFLRWPWLSDTVTSSSLCLGFPPMVWAASVSAGSSGGSERRCERPWNGLPPSSAWIHFWTCNKTRLRQPAWRVRAHRWGYRKPPPHCWDSARSSCPATEKGGRRGHMGKENNKISVELLWEGCCTIEQYWHYIIFLFKWTSDISKSVFKFLIQCLVNLTFPSHKQINISSAKWLLVKVWDLCFSIS